MSNQQWQTLLQRPIAFHPRLARLFGSINAAIYWQQLFYWSDKGKRSDGFIYKTKEDIEDETTLTEYQQDRVRKLLEEKGWLETKLLKANGAPTLHYRVHPEAVMESIYFQKYRKSGMETQETQESKETQETQDSITESTTETTARISKEIQNSTNEEERTESSDNTEFYSKSLARSAFENGGYDVVPTNLDGDEVSPRKKPQTWDVEKRVFQAFAEKAKVYTGIEPEPAKLWQLKQIRQVLPNYTKNEILEIFDDWFSEAPDDKILSVHAALSAHNLNKYKMKK